MSDRHPCPCCEHLVLDAMPGSYGIREDDGVRFRRPATVGGAHKVSLIEARRDDQDFGACDQHGRQYVRPPSEAEPLDRAWRPIDLTRASFGDREAEEHVPWPDDRSVLCRRLPTFRRREWRAS